MTDQPPVSVYEARSRANVRRERPPRAPVPWRTILATMGLGLAFLVTLWLAWHLRRIIAWVVIAAFFAVILNPAVDRLSRAGIRRRGFATAIVFLVCALLIGGLVYLFVRPAYNAGQHFVTDFPAFVRRSEEGKGRVGKLVRRYHLERWARQNEPKARQAISRAGGPALSVARRVVSGLAGFTTILVIAFLLLLEAPGLIDAGLALLPPERADRVRHIARDVSRSVTGYVIGNAATSVIAGVVVYITLLIVGVPFAFLFGLWVALVDLLPLVGGLLAGVPTVIVAFLHSVSAGITMLIVFLVYQQIENHVLNPLIMSRTVKLNPLWVILSVLVGADLGGIVGALLAIPAAGAIQVIVRDVWDNRRGQPKREPTVGAERQPVSEVRAEGG